MSNKSKNSPKNLLIEQILRIKPNTDKKMLSSMTTAMLKSQLELLGDIKKANDKAAKAEEAKRPISRGKSNVNAIRVKNLLDYLYDSSIAKELCETGKYIKIEPLQFCYIMNINVDNDTNRFYYRGQKPVAKDNDKLVMCSKTRDTGDNIGNSYGAFMYNDFAITQQIGVFLARAGIVVKLKIPEYSYVDSNGKNKSSYSKLGACALKKAGFDQSNCELELHVGTCSMTEFDKALNSHEGRKLKISDNEISEMKSKLSNKEESENVGIFSYTWQDHLIAHVEFAKSLNK